MSATGDFGPAPPGVNLAENQNAYMLVPVSIVAVIGTTAAALRLALRFKTETGLGIDDYFIIPAIVRASFPRPPILPHLLIELPVFLMGYGDILFHQ